MGHSDGLAMALMLALAPALKPARRLLFVDAIGLPGILSQDTDMAVAVLDSAPAAQ